MFVAVAGKESLGFIGGTRQKSNLDIGLLAVAVA
jgi:hypothetical protein